MSFELRPRRPPAASVGGRVGGSVDAGISWGSSAATSYSGTVGSLPAESFAANQYSFGLFTYLLIAGPARPVYCCGQPETLRDPVAHRILVVDDSDPVRDAIVLDVVSQYCPQPR